MRYLSYRPANGFKRAVAYLIDTLPIQLMLYVVSKGYFEVSPIVDSTAPPKVQDASFHAAMLITGGTFGLWMIYCILGELSPWHGTYGKKVMGIAVRTISGNRLTPGQILGRNAAKILSAAPCYLGFFFAFFTHGNRAWHDSLSGTAVSDRR